MIDSFIDSLTPRAVERESRREKKRGEEKARREGERPRRYLHMVVTAALVSVVMVCDSSTALSCATPSSTASTQATH